LSASRSRCSPPRVSADIYGVRNGTIATDSGNFENTGDDVVLSEWFWFNFATLTIDAGYISFATIALLTGTTVVSSGTSPNDYYALPLWTDSALNVAPVSVVVRVPSKDSAGAVRTLDFVLYKVQMQPFNFTGPSYKTGLTVSFTGRALLTNTNEVGGAIPGGRRQIGRLISAPGILTPPITVAEPFPNA
jgi:hypothetical protein